MFMLRLKRLVHVDIKENRMEKGLAYIDFEKLRILIIHIVILMIIYSYHLINSYAFRYLTNIILSELQTIATPLIYMLLILYIIYILYKQRHKHI